MTSTNIASFADFEALVGRDVASDALDRLCEECWGRSSQYGVRVDDLECLDTVGDNHRATGAVEQDNAWYGFGVRYGTSYGVQLDYFEIEEDAPEELAQVNHPARFLQAGVTSYMRSADHLSLARGRSLALLHSLHRVGSFAAQPRLVHDLLGGVMGDIAVQQQDFAADALRLVRHAFTSQQNLQDLFDVLSTELRLIVGLTARQAGWSGTEKAFFAAGLGYLPSTLLDGARFK